VRRLVGRRAEALCLKRTFWREVDGHRFLFVTVREGCAYTGQWAIYHGPFKAVMDEEGHFFPRHEPVAVCTDTAEKLRRPPYRGFFTVADADEAEEGCKCSEEDCCP